MLACTNDTESNAEFEKLLLIQNTRKLQKLSLPKKKTIRNLDFSTIFGMIGPKYAENVKLFIGFVQNK